MLKMSCYFNTKRLVVLLFLMVLSSFISAQVSEGGKPLSFSKSLEGIVPDVKMPAFDVQALIDEDAQAEALKDIPPRFGNPMRVDLNINNSGLWTMLEDGSRIWRLRIESANAFSINLIYDKFQLPEGGKLYLYNDNHSMVLGAFTARNNKEHKEFATFLTTGDAVTLEYFEPEYAYGQTELSISTVVHGYKDLLGQYEADAFGSSGACNNNVNCPEGEEWQNEKRSVAMIILGSGSRYCSGSMINNVRQDLTQYFLTANHCLSNPNTFIIMFNYESPDCNNVDGPTTMTVQGTQVVANNSSSDFALLLLEEEIPEEYNIHYSGWNAVNENSMTGVGIHHPAGDIKKISFDYDPYTTSDYDPSPYLADSHWEITAWDDGTTEGGSSGSPLYDPEHRIVGQLHGGWASCSSITQDYYGKFSMSWDYGSTPETRLKDWLDPDNTGTMQLSGWDPTMSDPDIVPPTAVNDLDWSNNTSESITLTWSAPYDTSFGGVRKYDLRMSTSPINDTTDFNNAMMVEGVPTPGDSASAESFTVENLSFGTMYYFALRSEDMYHNVSDLSNTISAYTLATPEMSVTPASVSAQLNSNETTTKTVSIANVSDSASTLNYSVELANNNFPSDMVKVRVLPKVTAVNALEEVTKEKDLSSNGYAIEGAGGPDAFGYEWIDSNEEGGPAYVWNDISSTGTAASGWEQTGTYNALDEGYAGPFDLGFNFKFYGMEYSQVYVSSNGFLTFDALTMNAISNQDFPSSTAPHNIISGFWDDLSGVDGGTVYYQQMGNKFVVQFTDWPEYGSNGGEFTFQMVLYSSGKIEFFYNSMGGDLTSATVGIENADGTDGLTASYNMTYAEDEMAVKFAAEPDWLSTNSSSGTITAGNSFDLELTFASEDFPDGEYSMDMIVSSNDPDNSEVTVPVGLTIGVPVINEWDASIAVSDEFKKTDIAISFGQKVGATDGIDTELGEFELPPTPPAGVLDFRFELPGSMHASMDYRDEALTEATWKILVQPGSFGYPLLISWNPDNLPEGSFTLRDVVTGSLVNVDMKAESSYDLNNSGITALEIVYTQDSGMSIDMTVNDGWNMLSVPLHTTDMSVSTMFDDATSPAYMYNGQYVMVDEFSMGMGYWLKFDTQAQHTVEGEPDVMQVAVSEGWNMVGVFHETVSASAVASNPAGLHNGIFYGFDEGYYTADNLEPGHAYWVKSTGDGTLNMMPTAAKKGASNVVDIKAEIAEMSNISIIDANHKSANLYLSETTGEMFELPPVPPAGVFDARFSTGKFVENASTGMYVNLQGAEYPVSVTAGADIVINNGMEEYTVKKGGSVKLENDFGGFSVKSVEIPETFTLSQNYPNPFNPSTKIEFALPVEANVTFEVYNMLGEKVFNLNNKKFSAGIQKIDFVASGLSSGIYLYSINVKGVDGNTYAETKKMILLK